MIIDTLADGADNPFYPAAIRRALQGIRAFHLAELAPGKYPIEGELIFMTLVEGVTRPLDQQRPEFHRQYIDVHLVLAGEEIVGAATRDQRKITTEDFDREHDIGFCPHMGTESLIRLAPGDLVLVFPGELHRPMATLGQPARLRKVIAKIDVSLLPPYTV